MNWEMRDLNLPSRLTQDSSSSVLYSYLSILKILWGLFNSVLRYELICDESTKIHVFVVVFFLHFRWLISINSKFQWEHNFNQLLGSIPSFGLKITSSNYVEIAQNQALITYGKTKKICVCADRLRRLRRSFVP